MSHFAALNPDSNPDCLVTFVIHQPTVTRACLVGLSMVAIRETPVSVDREERIRDALQDRRISLPALVSSA